jgi:hypothetical protein
MRELVVVVVARIDRAIDAVAYRRAMMSSCATRALRLMSTLPRLVFVPVMVGILGAWVLVGDVSETGGQDYIVRIPFAERHPTVLGLVGLVGALGAGIDLAINWRTRPVGIVSPTRVALLAASIGVLVGVVLRFVTARVDGANIGGGFLMIVGPVVVIPLLVRAVVRARAIASSTMPPS